jgi:predicted class III extradiol MEMO1 family dioxygenase
VIEQEIVKRLTHVVVAVMVLGLTHLAVLTSLISAVKQESVKQELGQVKINKELELVKELLFRRNYVYY